MSWGYNVVFDPAGSRLALGLVGEAGDYALVRTGGPSAEGGRERIRSGIGWLRAGLEFSRPSYQLAPFVSLPLVTWADVRGEPVRYGPRPEKLRAGLRVMLRLGDGRAKRERFGRRCFHPAHPPARLCASASSRTRTASTTPSSTSSSRASTSSCTPATSGRATSWSGWSALAPVVGVYGNIDGPPVRGRFGEHARILVGGMRLWMTHIGGHPGGPKGGRGGPRACKRPAARRAAGPVRLRPQPHPAHRARPGARRDALRQPRRGRHAGLPPGPRRASG